MSARPASVVIATHDIDLAAEVADRVVLLEGRRAVDLGPPEIAFAAGTKWATQIARLFPGGPVTAGGALAALGASTWRHTSEPR
jgi:energy-coupling factor transport system ATP-binding protein